MTNEDSYNNIEVISSGSFDQYLEETDMEQ